MPHYTSEQNGRAHHFPPVSGDDDARLPYLIKSWTHDFRQLFVVCLRLQVSNPQWRWEESFFIIFVRTWVSTVASDFICRVQQCKLDTLFPAFATERIAFCRKPNLNQRPHGNNKKIKCIIKAQYKATSSNGSTKFSLRLYLTHYKIMENHCDAIQLNAFSLQNSGFPLDLVANACEARTMYSQSLFTAPCLNTAYRPRHREQSICIASRDNGFTLERGAEGRTG